MFADEGADAEAFYLDETGSVNLLVVRSAAGEIVGMESISAQKAQEYQDTFFAEELGGSVPNVQEIAKVQERVQADANKYEEYRPFGVTYSEADGILHFQRQRVKFLIDQAKDEGVYALWTDEAGTVNLAVFRDTSGYITGIERITNEKAQEYQNAADPQIDLDGLEEKVEAKMSVLYPDGIE